MSAHYVYVVIKGKDLKKYEINLDEILNKGFKYDWFYYSDVNVYDDEIIINEQTKNCDFTKLVNAITKGMPEVNEIYYSVTPYWKAQDISVDNCDDQFYYWTNNPEWQQSIFGDKRFKSGLFTPYGFTLKAVFDKAIENNKAEIEEDCEDPYDHWLVISEAYSMICDGFYQAIREHKSPDGWYYQKVD